MDDEKHLVIGGPHQGQWVAAGPPIIQLTHDDYTYEPGGRSYEPEGGEVPPVQSCMSTRHKYRSEILVVGGPRESTRYIFWLHESLDVTKNNPAVLILEGLLTIAGKGRN